VSWSLEWSGCSNSSSSSSSPAVMPARILVCPQQQSVRETRRLGHGPIAPGPLASQSGARRVVLLARVHPARRAGEVRMGKGQRNDGSGAPAATSMATRLPQLIEAGAVAVRNGGGKRARRRAASPRRQQHASDGVRRSRMTLPVPSSSYHAAAAIAIDSSHSQFSLQRVETAEPAGTGDRSAGATVTLVASRRPLRASGVDGADRVATVASRRVGPLCGSATQIETNATQIELCPKTVCVTSELGRAVEERTRE